MFAVYHAIHILRCKSVLLAMIMDNIFFKMWQLHSSAVVVVGGHFLCNHHKEGQTDGS